MYPRMRSSAMNKEVQDLTDKRIKKLNDMQNEKKRTATNLASASLAHFDQPHSLQVKHPPSLTMLLHSDHGSPLVPPMLFYVSF